MAKLGQAAGGMMGGGKDVGQRAAGLMQNRMQPTQPAPMMNSSASPNLIQELLAKLAAGENPGNRGTEDPRVRTMLRF